MSTKQITLTIEQLAIIANGLDSLLEGWNKMPLSEGITEEEKSIVRGNILSVQASIGNQTGL